MENSIKFEDLYEINNDGKLLYEFYTYVLKPIPNSERKSILRADSMVYDPETEEFGIAIYDTASRNFDDLEGKEIFRYKDDNNRITLAIPPSEYYGGSILNYFKDDDYSKNLIRNAYNDRDKLVEMIKRYIVDYQL